MKRKHDYLLLSLVLLVVGVRRHACRPLTCSAWRLFSGSRRCGRNGCCPEAGRTIPNRPAASGWFPWVRDCARPAWCARMRINPRGPALAFAARLLRLLQRFRENAALFLVRRCAHLETFLLAFGAEFLAQTPAFRF